MPQHISFVRRTVADTRIDGHFHRLKQHDHSRLEGQFGRYVQWRDACRAVGISTGTYMAVIGAGTGTCEIISKEMGPFMDA